MITHFADGCEAEQCTLWLCAWVAQCLIGIDVSYGVFLLLVGHAFIDLPVEGVEVEGLCRVLLLAWMCALCVGGAAVVCGGHSCVLGGEAEYVLGCLIGCSGLHSGVGGARSLELWWNWMLLLHLMFFSYFFCLQDHFINLLLILPQQWLLWFICYRLCRIRHMQALHWASAGVAWESRVHRLRRFTWFPLLQYLCAWWADLCILEGHDLFLISLAWDRSLLLRLMLHHMDQLFVFRINSILNFGFSAWTYQTPSRRGSIVLALLAVLAAPACFQWTKSLWVQFAGRITFTNAHEAETQLLLLWWSWHLVDLLRQVLILSGTKDWLRLGYIVFLVDADSLIVDSGRSTFDAFRLRDLSRLQMTRDGDLALSADFSISIHVYPA